MKDDWFEGSLFDESELDAVSSLYIDGKDVSLKEKTSSNQRSDDQKVENEIYLTSIPSLSDRSQAFLLSKGIKTIKDLIDYDRYGGHEAVLEKGKKIADNIGQVIDDYYNGSLFYDEYIPKKSFPSFGVLVEEEKPSLSILAYGLSNRCLNILFKKGVFTIGQFVAVMRNYSLNDIEGLGSNSKEEMMDLWKAEKDKWKDIEFIVEERKSEKNDSVVPSSFVFPADSDNSENLLFLLPKKTFDMLGKINVSTFDSLLYYLSKYSVFKIPEITMDDITAIISLLESKKDKKDECIDLLSKYYKATEHFIKDKITDNKRIVYLKREEGDVLESVGNLIGVTRQRVRQIERNVTNILLPYASVIIGSELKDRKLIREEEIKSRFAENENARIFIKAMKEVKETEYLECSSCFLKSSDNPYYLRLERITDEIIGASAELEEKMAQLNDAFNEEGLEFMDLDSLLRFLSSKGYHIYNNFVSKRKQRYRELAIKAIEKYFPDGINLTQLNKVVSPDMERLKSLVKSEYNYTIDLPNRVFYTRLTGEDELILIDRSKFMPVSKFHIEMETLNHIEEAIVANPSNQIYFRTLFEEMKDYLPSRNINNHNCLHGVIQHYLPGLCTCARDYLVKDRSSFVPIPTSKKIEELVRNNGRPMSFDEIKAQFPGFTYVMIVMPLAENINIIRLRDDKIYLMDLLSFSNEELEGLKRIICTSLDDNNGYTNGRILHSLFSSSEYGDLLKSKSLDCPMSAFSLAKFLLKGEDVTFSNCHIARRGCVDISSFQTICKGYLGEPDIISHSAFVSLCDKLKIDTLQRDITFKDIVRGYVRINKDEYMDRKRFDEIQADLIPSLSKYVRAHMTDDYFSLINFQSFSSLPQSKLEWNEFLLDSLISLSGEFDLFQGGVSDRRLIRTIVTTKGRYSSYAELVARFLDKRGIKSISDQELKDILNANNLYKGKVPTEIRNSEIFRLEGDIWYINLDGEE